MSVCPRPVAKCPACQNEHDGLGYKVKGFMIQHVQIVCGCGVRGPWVRWDQDACSINGWNVAARGWEKIAGPWNPNGTPPPPRK